MNAPTLTALQAELIDEQVAEFRKAHDRHPDRGELLEQLAERASDLRADIPSMADEFDQLFDLYRDAAIEASLEASNEQDTDEAYDAALEANLRQPFRRDLTVDELEDGLNHPDYAGFGYLGARAMCGRIAMMQTVDAAVLDRANELGWDAEQLQGWATSKAGRWLGDETFGSTRDLDALRGLAVAAAARYMAKDQPR